MEIAFLTKAPRYILLDTSTWIYFSKNRSSPDVKEAFRILNSGDVVPFIPFECVWETLQSKNEMARLRTLEVFRGLKFVSFPKPIGFPAKLHNSPVCGSYFDVHEAEIMARLEHPDVTLDEIVYHVRPNAVSGFSSGGSYLSDDAVLQAIARTGHAIKTLWLNKAAASLGHTFPTNLREIVPIAGEYEMADPQQFEARKLDLINWLTKELETKGDKKLADPRSLAIAIVDMGLNEVRAVLDPTDPDPLRKSLSQILGIELSRLNECSTYEDFLEEALYCGRMRTHEIRMNMPEGTAYKNITKEELPWAVVWLALEKEAMASGNRAEGGNMFDFPVAEFALYIDKVQVDKRVLHHKQAASAKSPLLKTVLPNVFKAGNGRDVLQAIKALAPNSKTGCEPI